MGRKESLEKGVAIWTGAVEALRARMKEIKNNYRFSWWLRPSYWKVEREHYRMFHQLINYRIKYATAMKESK